MITKFLDPKNDLAFKRIFGTERNKDILIHFLNDMYGRTTNPIEDVTFLKTNLDPKIASQRESIVDVLCRDTLGEHFIIEMQVSDEPGFVKRAQHYAAKAYIEQRDKGIGYKDLKSVTFMAITSYILFPDKADYLSHHQVRDVATNEHDLKDFSFTFLELPKFKLTKDQLTTMTQKWAYFFKNAKETHEAEVEAIVGADLILKRAYEELNRFGWSQEELRGYDSVDMKRESDKACLWGAEEKGLQKGLARGRKEGKKEGIKEGIAKGMEKGMEKGRKEIAKALLKNGMDVEEVAKITSLPLETIELLKIEQ